MRLALPLVGLIVIATPATALDLPARKPGLWELKMTFEGRSLPPQTMQHCIDAATDKQMNTIGGAMRRDMCSKQEVQQVGSTIVVDSICKVGAATVTSHGVVSGDFNSAYTVKVTSKREGAAAPGMPASGESNMSVEAKWLGACKAGQKPGDIIMAGGRKINIHDLRNIPSTPGAPKAPPKKQ